MQIRILIISILSLYAVSFLPSLSPNYGLQSDLKTTIKLVQQLSKSSNSEEIGFKSAFHNSLKSLRLTAGIKVIVFDVPLAGQHHEPSMLILDQKPLHLLSAAWTYHFFGQQIEKHFDFIIRHKALPIPPPTPPPLIS